MKLSLRALRSWLESDLSAREVGNVLGELGFPNDGIESVGQGLDVVVIGKILEKTKHPRADRLSLLKVTIGHETLPIVCGAANMKEGDFIVVAPVGAIIPGKDLKGLEIKEAAIRGEISKGMCCAQAELALSDESDGLWILPPSKVSDADLGRKVNELFPWSDDILTIDITPNRPDAMSVKGLARELAAKLSQKLKQPAVHKFKWGASSSAPAINPGIENMADTMGFAACLVHGVQWQPSAPDVVAFLKASGARSISNLVDITNQVLFELGHPIHFFDADKMDPYSVTIRRAKSGERLRLLNEQEIELSPEDLVVADRSGPLSLAGIMGGSSSSVSESTKNILVEVACFQPALIRASARRHGLNSESSLRFERGLTPYRFDDVLERVLALLKEASGFTDYTAGKSIDVKLRPKEVLWSRVAVEKKLGKLSKTDDEIFEALRRLEYEIIAKGQSPLVVFPWYRVDGYLLEDVMEDIARLMGYNNLEQRPLSFQKSIPVLESSRASYIMEDNLIDRFVNQGFSELINLNFSHETREKLLGYQEIPLVTLANPLNAERSQLRARLLPELVLKIRDNAHCGEEDLWVVEAGTIFLHQGESRYESSAFPEQGRIACAWYPRPHEAKVLWKSTCDPFFVFKGKMEAVWNDFKWAGQRSQDRPHLHPAHRIEMRGGYFGELHPLVMKRLDLPGRLFVGEWQTQGQWRSRRFGEATPFPSITLDASLWIDRDVTAKELQDAFHASQQPLLKELRLYDVFEPENEARKSFTFSMRYQSAEKTLSIEEAKAIHDGMVDLALKAFAHKGIALR